MTFKNKDLYNGLNINNSMDFTKNLKESESESVLDCQMCRYGSAVAQCVECWRDDEESLMCTDCLADHTGAQAI